MLQDTMGKEADISDTPKSEQKEQAPTAEEQLKSLQSKVQELTAEKERLDKGYKGLQQTLSAKDREIKKQTELESRIAGIQDTMELLATAIAEGKRGDTDNLGETPSQPGRNILKELQAKKQEQETKRQQETEKQTQAEYTHKADALYARAQAIFGEDDENIEHIEDLLMSGRYERAEARIVKAERSKGMKGEQSVETEDKKIERLVGERLKKELQDRGLLEEHSGYPSAGSSNAIDAMNKYIKGEITAEEAQKRGVKFD